MKLDNKIIKKIIDDSLVEDIGQGDVTSDSTLPADKNLTASFRTRQNITLCGAEILQEIFGNFADNYFQRENSIKFTKHYNDGDKVAAGQIFFEVEGNARFILMVERVALNLTQFASAIATHTAAFVEQLAGTNCKLLDTRKTVPMLRHLSKYAVYCGGGVNHRYCLDDAILIKDNHIAVSELSISEIIAKAKDFRSQKFPNANSEKLSQILPIIIECDTIEQLQQAIKATPDRVLLDNMSPDLLRQCLKLLAGTGISSEASGNINLSTAREIALTGVDFISVGAITHSAPSVDIGLDI